MDAEQNDGTNRALHPSEAKFTYGCARPIDNLHIIFGTRNIIKMLAPVKRNLPICGLEWTQQKIQNLTGTNIERRQDDEPTEETGLTSQEESAELRNLEIKFDEGI